jgi:hypothetical protein
VPKYNGIKNALKLIYANEGFKGLYKGFYISLFSQASSMSFFFWQYFSINLDMRPEKASTRTRVVRK